MSEVLEEATGVLRFEAVGGVRIAPIGLGCSRLGSVLAGGADESRRVLAAASENGITLFDTADIYGQGESERLLGRYLANTRAPAFVVTKVGQRFPAHLRALLPFKAVVAATVRRLNHLGSTVAAVRSRQLPRDFAPRYVGEAYGRSLRRLGLPSVDALLLHGPAAGVVADGAVLSGLQALRKAGRVRAFGISCDSVESAWAMLDHPDFEVIEVPISLSDRRFVEVAQAARRAGRLVLGRELLGGVRPSGAAPMGPDEVTERMAVPIEEGWVDVALVGTTNADRLNGLLARLRARGIALPSEGHGRSEP